jgi:dephospho-CoA kinase
VPKLVIGLTGGIGSGKSAAASIFAEFGASVVDTDVIAHGLTQPNGVAMPAITEAFGKNYIDDSGGLNRVAMRTLVFSQPHAKRQLEEILHPLIGVAVNDLLEQATGLYHILVVPLLIESGSYRDQVDRILVVDCNEQMQLTRAMTRIGLTEGIVRAIMASQASRTERLAVADDVINNDGDLAELRAKVYVLHQHYMALTTELNR